MFHKFDFECSKYRFPKSLMKIIFLITIGFLTYYLVISKSIFFYRKPFYKPVLGGLNQYDIVLENGENYHLYIFGINKRVSYQSSDIKVATVNSLGYVRTWRTGTTIIRVRCNDKELRCRVKVIGLNRKKLYLKVGKSKRLNVKSAIFGVKYRSSNKSVVTVNCFGRVKAVGKGKATITATYRRKCMKCTVIVK